MFLMRKTALLLTSDRGSSLLAVIGLMAVAGVATLAIAGSTMNSIGVSSATRASVQAQSAAEAGIDDALLKLTTNTCAAAAWGVTNPVSAVSVSYSTSATNDTWVAACPIASALRVKILSTGAAADTGVGGNATGDRATVEAIYAYKPATAATPAAGGSTALYSYKIGSFSGSTIFDSTITDLPMIQVKHGDATCGETSIAGTGILNFDVVVEDGGLNLDGSCQVRGDVWSSAQANLIGSSQVWGNLMAPSIDATGSAKFHKNLYTSGLMTLRESAWVLGSVSAGTLNMSGSAKVDQNAWSAGSTFMGPTASTIAGTLTTQSFDPSSSGFAVGATVLVPTGSVGAPVAPTAPVVPEWVDIDYDANDWPGYDRVTISGACNFATVAALATASSKPTLVDAFGCDGGVFLKGSLGMNLPNDLVIFADSFQIGGSAQVSAAAGSDRKLWLITPDNTPDNKPTCTASPTLVNEHSNITESFIVQNTVSALLYTPCNLSMGFSAQWHGQFYGGSVSTTGSSQLHYSDVGDSATHVFTRGTPGSAGSAAGLGARISIRDLHG